MKNVSMLIGDLFEILLCVYAVVKYIFKKNFSICNNKNFDTVLELFYIVTSLIFYAIITIMLSPFVVARYMLDIYLRKKYGTKYKGLLKGLDSIWLVDSKQTRHIINSFMVIEIKKSPEELVNHFRSKAKESRRIQFNSTVHNIWHAWYRLECDDIVESVIKIIDLSEDERRYKHKFEEKMSRLSNEPLPKSALFEILVSSEPITFYDTKNLNNSNYILIQRFHHSLGDGINLLRFLLKHLIDRDTLPKEIKPILTESSKFSSVNFYSKFIKIIKNGMEYMNRIPDIMKKAYLCHYTPVEPADENILRGPELSGEKILVYYIEDEARFVSRIKAIKKHIAGCRFSDVMYAALSASLWKYFRQHDEDNIPANVYMSFISRCPKEESHHNHENEMNSTLCSSALSLPITINETKENTENLLTRLKIIVARNTRYQQSIDPLVYYWTIRHSYPLPAWILRHFYRFSLKSTMSLSNLPGIHPVTINGESVKDIVFWTPNCAKIGLGISILSYDGRFQIGLTADKALIPTKAQATFILENFCKYVELLEEEINTSL